MIYGSVCSGIEAASLAFEPLGWSPAWFSEIDKFPSAVLAHRYPSVPNLGDMTRIHDDERFRARPIDLLVGGTPCQSFSVAGLRKGLADPRGNLALVFLRLVDIARPRYVVWENVPGVLSINGGRDFGSFVTALGQLGYGWSYRILDAQNFGVPQRRRRVFVVGYLGDWRRAAAVLFEPESLCGDFKKGGQKKKGVAALTATGVGTCGATAGEVEKFWGRVKITDNCWLWTGGCGGNGYGSVSLGSRTDDTRRLIPAHRLAYQLVGGVIPDGLQIDHLCRNKKCVRPDHLEPVTQRENILRGEAPSALAARKTHCKNGHIFSEENTHIKKDGSRSCRSCHNIQQCAAAGYEAKKVVSALSATGVGATGADDNQAQAGHLIAHTLRGEGFDASEDGTGRGTPIVPITFNARQNPITSERALPLDTDGTTQAVMFDPYNNAVSPQSPSLGTNCGMSTGRSIAITPQVFESRFARNGRGAPEDVCPPLKAQSGGTGKGDSSPLVNTGLAVRRLLPVECERLQGMPDNHTMVPWRGKAAAECPDGPRYKAIGNSMCVDVMSWLGRRIQAVEETTYA